MDQLNNGLLISVERSIPLKLQEATVDDFARELLDLWESRHMYGYVITAFAQGKVPIGFILLEDHAFGNYTIRGVWVSEIFRNSGIGTRMMREVFQIAGSTSRIWVNITPGSEKFYEKFNFNMVGSRSDFGQTIGVYSRDYNQTTLEELARLKYGEKYVAPKKSILSKFRKR